MKILLDNNLSFRLVTRLAEEFPKVSHVEMEGLAAASDQAVWAFAKKHGFMIVTKDSDFSEIQVLQGFPPKVVWIHLGNCTTGQVEDLLRRNVDNLTAFEADPHAGMLHLE